MDEQLIYPVHRILGNPRVLKAIANWVEGPDWEILAEAFYDLIENEFTENPEVEPQFSAAEVCFRRDPEDERIIQVVLSTGQAMELRPIDGDEYHAEVKTENDLSVVSTIYNRLVKAIEEEKPELKGNIVLCDPPTPGNGFLRDTDGNAFRGRFHLLDNPEQEFGFVVDIIDLQADVLKASIE